MEKRKLITALLLAGSLSLLLTGCGDELTTPVEKGNQEIEKADGSVNDLNKLTEQAEDAVKEAGE